MTDLDENENPGDPHDLGRFLEAQEECYEQVLRELHSGQKRSHWMWFIFPQFDGLGLSATSRRYAIKSISEAKAYLGHTVLGSRLRECVEAVQSIEGRSALEIFGSPDDVKLRSCATLFAFVSSEGSVFHSLLLKYFQGEGDSQTLRLIGVSIKK